MKLTCESPNPSKKEHNKATDGSGGVKYAEVIKEEKSERDLSMIFVSPMSVVSPRFALFGKFKKIKKNAMTCTINPRITIGSRPILFDVLAPSNPNRTPPETSPTPMKIPDKPTSCLADSPMA
ncbi:CLUMA_CG006873, isoform A [Clunio marinus]|uniref:CLUMA_CG006873, isoform A n=1 Tax=Clunio marinus TaxID=568069 RepID=A0A1J1I166_9DIPT|nr:CLUMA_CG006873, isoform A [Clunio marinus]